MRSRTIQKECEFPRGHISSWLSGRSRPILSHRTCLVPGCARPQNTSLEQRTSTIHSTVILLRSAWSKTLAYYMPVSHKRRRLPGIMFGCKVSLKPVFISPVRCLSIGAPKEAMMSVVACGPLLPTNVPNHSPYTMPICCARIC
jgi:hypothetical protein